MHVITNEIVWIRQLHFAHATFFLSSEVSVVFNISSSHYNTNLPIRRFSQEQFLVSKNNPNIKFFSYVGFLSRTFTNHRTAGEGEGHFFNSLLPLPPASQTLGH